MFPSIYPDVWGVLLEIGVTIPIYIITFFSLYQLFLCCSMLTARYTGLPSLRKRGHMGTHPFVTIQICCYNEANVIETTIASACSQNWPPNKFQVCILDDSSDTTSSICDRAALFWRNKGINVKVLRRPTREGYKAGNLAFHFSQAEASQSEFIAILDADHRAHPDFLASSLPFFYKEDGGIDTSLGMVQCPWTFYNARENTLTSAQSLLMDYHFSVEQFTKSYRGGIFSFNGTGGIWRTDTIRMCGGWKSDTVTEDLDISYRALLGGESKEVRFFFNADIGNALELPGSYRAFRVQRSRWCKGYSQVMRKSMKELLGMDVVWKVKAQMIIHLLDNVPNVALFLFLLLSPLSMCFDRMSSRQVWMLLFLGITQIVKFGIVITNSVSCREEYLGKELRYRFVEVFLLFAIFPGTSLFLTYSFFEGFFSQDATFQRTPKRGTPFDKGHTQVHIYGTKLCLISSLEMAMSLYYICMGLYLSVLFYSRGTPFKGMGIGLCSAIVGYSFFRMGVDEFVDLVYEICAWRWSTSLPGVEEISLSSISSKEVLGENNEDNDNESIP